MAGRTTSRWGLLPALLTVVVPVASGAGLTLADGTLAAGNGTLAACDSGSPTITQNVGSGGNATNVVSLEVGGIGSSCGGGTVKVSLYNGTDPAQEATTAIPDGGGTVTVTLNTAVPLKDAHFVAVTLQGP